MDQVRQHSFCRSDTVLARRLQPQSRRVPDVSQRRWFNRGLSTHMFTANTVQRMAIQVAEPAQAVLCVRVFTGTHRAARAAPLPF